MFSTTANFSEKSQRIGEPNTSQLSRKMDDTDDKFLLISLIGEEVADQGTSSEFGIHTIPHPKSAHFRFLTWVSWSRRFSLAISETQRRTCPLINCESLFSDENEMLRHVWTCLRHSKGTYRCFKCGGEERMDRYHINSCQAAYTCEGRFAMVVNSLRSMKRRLCPRAKRQRTSGWHEETDYESWEDSMARPVSKPCLSELVGSNVNAPSEMETDWHRETPVGFLPEVAGPEVQNPVELDSAIAPDLNYQSMDIPPQFSAEESATAVPMSWPKSPEASARTSSKYSFAGPLLYQHGLASPEIIGESPSPVYDLTMSPNSTDNQIRLLQYQNLDNRSDPGPSGSWNAQPLRMRTTNFNYTPRGVSEVSPCSPCDWSGMSSRGTLSLDSRSERESSIDLSEFHTTYRRSTNNSSISSYDRNSGVPENHQPVPPLYFGGAESTTTFAEPESMDDNMGFPANNNSGVAYDNTTAYLDSTETTNWSPGFESQYHYTNDKSDQYYRSPPAGTPSGFDLVHTPVSPSTPPAPPRPDENPPSPPQPLDALYILKCFICGHEPGDKDINDQRSNLKRHMKTCGSKIRPFVCSFPGCGKAYKRSDNLLAHQKVKKHSHAWSPDTMGDGHWYKSSLGKKSSSDGQRVGGMVEWQ